MKLEGFAPLQCFIKKKCYSLQMSKRRRSSFLKKLRKQKRRQRKLSSKLQGKELYKICYPLLN